MRMVAHVKPFRAVLPAVAPPADWSGRIEHVSDVRRAGRAGVDHVVLDDGQRWCLKRHATAGRRRQEVEAVRHARQGGLWGVPAITPTEQGVLLPWVDGQPGQAHDRDVVQQAAGWLRALHALMPRTADDPVPLKDAYHRRWARLRRKLKMQQEADHGDGSWLRADDAWQAAWQAAEARPTRTPTHGDYLPHNWIVNNGLLKAVIDFEFARDDTPERDLARYWLHAGGVGGEDWMVFMKAYGVHGLSDAWLQLACLLEAGGTLEVGLNTHDVNLVRLGMDGLQGASDADNFKVLLPI